MGSERVQATFRDMVANNVGRTSTLAVYECLVPGRPTWNERTLATLSPQAFREDSTRNAEVKASAGESIWPAVRQKAMEHEVAFVKAGGLLTAGVDPAWCTPAGLGDQRQFELLAEAGFTLAQTVQIASANGAKVLGDFDRFGSLTPGKLADLVVVRGDLEASATNIRNVRLVFKEGMGYDSAKLLEAAKGEVGVR